MFSPDASDPQPGAMLVEKSTAKGSYNGMAEKHIFNVVIVMPDHGIVGSATPMADKTVSYSGEAATARF